MWPFKHKKKEEESQRFGIQCPRCGSPNTGLRVYHGTDHPDYVRVWRGQRSFTYRCFHCGLDFYAEEPRGGIVSDIISDDRVIDGEEALREAEEELGKEIEEDDDRRCR